MEMTIEEFRTKVAELFPECTWETGQMMGGGLYWARSNKPRMQITVSPTLASVSEEGGSYTMSTLQGVHDLYRSLRTS